VVFPYYQRLSRRQQAIYRASDRVHRVEVGNGPQLARHAHALRPVLEAGDRAGATRISQVLADALLDGLGVARVRVRVLAVRPSHAWGELHGLYEREAGRTARISVWMRTARNRRPVAFRTFVRTLVHEICHHLDYEHLALADSFHTQGFFRRESSLVRQITGGEAGPRSPPPDATGDARDPGARAGAAALERCRRILSGTEPAADPGG